MDKSGSRSGTRRGWTALIEGARKDFQLEQGQVVYHPPTGPAIARPGPPAVGRFGNRATWVDGRRFASKLEADRYHELLLERAAGGVAWFVRQVPFDVAAGVVYRADFVVVLNPTGTQGVRVRVEDTKGHLTATSRAKIAVVQERYGIQVHILRRCDVRRFT